MPTYNRATLRQALGQNHIQDTLVSSVTGSVAQTASLSHVIDAAQANPDFSGQSLYVRSWIYVNGMTLRVGSFNTASGAYVTAQVAATTIPSGAAYERHDILSPVEKNRALNDAIQRVNIDQEIAFPAVDGDQTYVIDAVASPNLIRAVLDAYYFTDPTNTTNRGRQNFQHVRVVTTGSGMELRVTPAIGASCQVVLDALLVQDLGADDAATVNLPDKRWVVAGAAAKAWDILLMRSAAQNRGLYEKNRDEAARLFSRLSRTYQAQVARGMDTLLDEPF